MPEITPIAQPGTITVQARTLLSQSPEKQFQEALKPQEPEKKTTEAPGPEEKQKPDERLLKARLIQERLKREIDVEKKKLAEERRQLEAEKANSRKWIDAQKLAEEGRYIEAAEKSGITYDQLTQQIINGGQVPPARVAETTAQEIARKEIEAFKKQMEEQQKTQQQQQYENAIKQIEADVKHLVDSSDKFPLVKESQSYQDIVKYVESEFHRTGRMVSLEEAIQRWEDEALQGLEELFKLEKVRSKVHKEESPRPTQERIPQTLNQRTAASIPAPKPMTDAERRQRAFDAFHGRLP